MPHRLPMMFLLFGMCQSLFATGDGLPDERLRELKAAAVYIQIENSRLISTGSGFLIYVDKDHGYIVTNHHVIDIPKTRKSSKEAVKTSVVFRSGTKEEQVVGPAEVILSNAKIDIAVLKVTCKNLPKPLDLSQTFELRETMAVYAIGFPLGKLLGSKTKGNPAVTIHKGSITSLREDAQAKLSTIQLDGGLQPGSSGGPIVDGQGRLVGVAQAGVLNTSLNFAIPAAAVRELVGVGVEQTEVYTKKVRADQAEFDVEIVLKDPIGKIKSASLYYVPKEGHNPGLKPEKDGSWPLLANAEKLVCRFDGKTARAEVQLKTAGRKKSEYLLQAVCVQSDGKTFIGAPAARELNFEAVSGPPIALLAGEWNVTYTNGAKRTYNLDRDGKVSALEGTAKTEGQVRQIQGMLALLLDGDNRMERLTLATDGRLIVEHFDPKTNFPHGKTTCIGLGVRSTPAPGKAAIEIVSAFYGATTHWLDVTEKVEKAVDGKPLWSTRVTNDNFGDPHPGNTGAMSLIIRYVVDGQVRFKAVQQGEDITLP